MQLGIDGANRPWRLVVAETAPHVTPLIRRLVATVLCNPRATPDALFVLADALAELTAPCRTAQPNLAALLELAELQHLTDLLGVEAARRAGTLQ